MLTGEAAAAVVPPVLACLDRPDHMEDRESIFRNSLIWEIPDTLPVEVVGAGDPRLPESEIPQGVSEGAVTAGTEREPMLSEVRRRLSEPEGEDRWILNYRVLVPAVLLLFCILMRSQYLPVLDSQCAVAS